MVCKICNKETSKASKVGITTHLKKKHELSFIDYMIEYENFVIPKCKCGKECKYRDGLEFSKTCANKKCVKRQQSESHIKWMKENPEKTAWRKSNMSYPEKLFISYLEESGLSNLFLIEREKSFFPYFIDFAFVDIQVAIEIDGSQHMKKDRKESDKIKDKLLKDKGWRVLRITAKEVKDNKEGVIECVKEFLGDINQKYKKVGVYLSPKKTYKLKERDENGFTEQQKKYHLSLRKVERPPYDQLIKEIEETNYRTVGRKYGVSDNSVRKWIRQYKKKGF